MGQIEEYKPISTTRNSDCSAAASRRASDAVYFGNNGRRARVRTPFASESPGRCRSIYALGLEPFILAARPGNEDPTKAPLLAPTPSAAKSLILPKGTVTVF